MSSTQKSLPTPLNSFKTPVHQIYGSSSSSSSSNALGKRVAAVVAVGRSPALTPRTPRTPRSLAPPSALGAGAGEQCEEEEEEARLKYRRLQMNGMATPGCRTPRGSSHKDRSETRHTKEGSSLSEAQMADLYTECLKLSTQNKINSKNAFGLHLIDHMSRILKKRGEMSNFQVASSTLDASAKIYAGRVDSIYNDIFKVLGGLGREAASKKGKGGEEGEDEGEGEEGGEGASGKKRKAKKLVAEGAKLMIEKDPKNLLSEFDFESRVDPLFQKTAAAFDEGGAEGLLLNNLTVQDDGCALTLDGSEKPATVDKPTEGIMVQVEEGLLDMEALQTKQICRTFADFKFNCTNTEGTWNMSNMQFQNLELGQEGARSEGVGQDADFTMLDCPPTVGDHTFEEGPPMDVDADQSFDEGNVTKLGQFNDNLVARFVGGAADSDKTGSPRLVIPGLQGGAEGGERQQQPLSSLIQPSEYSYFNPTILASWAGPQHWKFRPRNAITAKKLAGMEGKVKKRRTSKTFRCDFNKTPAKSALASGKGSTVLSKAVRSRLNSEQTLLPDIPAEDKEVRTDPGLPQRLFVRPKWMVKWLKANEEVEENLGGEWYNYGNDADDANFIPPMSNLGGGEDDSDDEGGAVEAMETDATPADFTMQGFLNETALPPGEVTMGARGGSAELEGENLLAQPRKVDKVKVNYARTAKKIDVKRLKSKMWDAISQPHAHQDDQVDSGSCSGGASSQEVEFSSLYSDLPSKVSNGMAQNLSVPICFVCLLHLANEKELRLVEKNDLSGFSIFTSE